ncbi:MAG: tetratricopeptide repeat protein [Lysobacter sp.]
MVIDEQAAWLDTACAGDAGLRAEVDRLLALDAEASSYFAELGATLARDDKAPSQIGVYRIAGEIGRGGMGTVYLGHRNDGQFEQHVAIKVVRDTVRDSDSMLARFRDERRILARLKHPGIAYLLDGGSLADGRPYFVMEYIHGNQITSHADHTCLDVRGRLRLFRDVCAAVAHAHRNLVIHRDLKPGNVMVQKDDQGHASIKLLDFGIARIIQDGLGDDPGDDGYQLDGDPSSRPVSAPAMTERSPTEYGERILTPRYAAPEQIRGEPATTSSDVYALGLLLHELLTGTHPFGTAVSTAHEMLGAIMAGSPTLPSLTASRTDAAVATLRDSTPRQLARQLRGDLDSIVLKAIQNDPDQRYASVGQLADDVRRHLEGDVVTARHATAAYRTGVFLRQHRNGVATTLLAVGASVLLASLHLSRITHERDLAHTEAAKARQVSNLLVSMLESADPEQARGEEISVREVLDRASSRIEVELAEQPDVRARMDAIIGTVYTRLGKYDKGETFLTRALDLQSSRHGPAHPETLDTMQAMATLAMRRGENGEAEKLLRKVLAQRLEQPQPDTMLVAATRNDLGAALSRQGKDDEAEVLYRAALAAATETAIAAPEALLSARNSLAVLLVGKGEFKEAEEHYRQVLAQRRELQGPAHPDLSNSLNNLGVLLSKQQRFPEAEQLLRESLAMKRKLYDGDQHPSVALAMSQLASVLTKQKRYEEAEPMYLQALDMRRKSLKSGHPHIATNLNNLANLYREQNDYDRAEPLYREAIAICREGMGPEHPWTASMIRNLGEMYLRAGKASAAEDSLREALRIRRTNRPEDHWEVADVQSLLGAALAEQGSLDAAKPLLNAGYTSLVRARGEQDQYTLNAKARLVALHDAGDAGS